MKPSEVKLDQKLVKTFLEKLGKRSAEYALVDLLSFCVERNDDSFDVICIKSLIAFFKVGSALDVRSEIKLQGLIVLLEQGYLRKLKVDCLTITPKLLCILEEFHSEPAPVAGSFFILASLIRFAVHPKQCACCQARPKIVHCLCR